MTNTNERLQKVIANSGYTSRRKAEQLIEEGKVSVNDKVVTELGTKVSKNDKIVVEGIPLEKEKPVYFMLYKPRGVISSVKDEKDRKTVVDFFPEIEERIYPIGRLDYDTSGLMLLTNDGEFAQMLMHPKHEVDKVYVAKVKGVPHKEEIKKLLKGLKIDNEYLKAVHVKITSVDKGKNTSIIEMILHEGKNRQVRRMFESLGYPVQKLKRERYGNLDLRGLQPGDYRALTPHEVKQIKLLAQKNVH